MKFKKGDIVKVTNGEDEEDFSCIVEIIEEKKGDDGGSYRCYILEVLIENEDVVTIDNIKPNNINDIDDYIHMHDFGKEFNDIMVKINYDTRTPLSILINNIYNKEKTKHRRK